MAADSTPETPSAVCATIVESNTDAVLALMQRVAAVCGWIELRLDGAPDLDLERILAARPRPVVVTCRAAREGGAWAGDETPRLERLRLAASLGAEWVDVEWDAVDALGDLPATCGLIVSRHAFDSTSPSEFEHLLASLRHPAATLQKLAVRVASAEDALALVERASREPCPTLAIAMGFRGVVSRLLGPRHAPFSYAAADPERPAAPGQLAASQLAQLLGGRQLSPATQLYGVIGNPVGHSRSPELMNAAFDRLGVDAVYSWLETDDPLALIRQAHAAGILQGASVTIPHKVTCVEHPSVAPAEEVRALGALNTLVRTESGWRGHNTDALAAQALLGAALPSPAGAHVAVLGNGGAARAVVWAAKALGCRVTLFARSPERARALASELAVEVGGTLSDVPAEGIAAVINATSVGMLPEVEQTPVRAGVFHPGMIAYDLVYTPPETRFLREAQQAGARRISGLEHFAAQAKGQLSLWLGPSHVESLDVGALLAASGAQAGAPCSDGSSS